jgi:uncharacterized OsmC-like protein
MTASLQPIATAVQRVQGVFKRRPEAAVHDDTPATARWQGGTRVVTSHADGTQLLTDMPVELGGSGDQVTPGWLFRAGLASCATTSIVLAAAAEGIELAALDVSVGSRSDARGLLGMRDDAGQPVDAGPADLHLQVRIDAPGVAPALLRALVEGAVRCSPVPSLVRQATPLALRLDIAGA